MECAHEWLEILTPTLAVSAQSGHGSPGLAGKSRVKGPGQKRSIKVTAAGGTRLTRWIRSEIFEMRIKSGLCLGLFLII